MLSEKGTRRAFLATSIGGATGVAISARAQNTSQPAGDAQAGGDAVRLGIVGAGIRGLELRQAALNAGGKIVAVCDLYDGHLRRAQEIQPNTPTTRDYREGVSRHDIAAVLVATSDHSHDPLPRPHKIHPNPPTTRDSREVVRRKNIVAVFLANSDRRLAPPAIRPMKA